MKNSTSLVLFSILALSISCLSAKDPKQIFSEWDKDKDGKLSMEELPRNARHNFKRVDTNRDGTISLAEHMAFLNRPRQPRKTRPLPEGIKAVRNLPYAQTENPRQTLDLFLPEKRAKDAPLPIIVYIHGGGWKNGRKESGLGKLAPYLATGSFAGACLLH